MSFPLNSYPVHAIPILKSGGVVGIGYIGVAAKYFCKPPRRTYTFKVKQHNSQFVVSPRVHSKFIRPPRTVFIKPAVRKTC